MSVLWSFDVLIIKNKFDVYMSHKKLISEKKNTIDFFLFNWRKNVVIDSIEENFLP